MTTVFRWYPIGPDRYVVTGNAEDGPRLAGYVGKDAKVQAKAKADALATWSRFLGHDAIVRDTPPLLSRPVNESEAAQDSYRPARGFTWSTLGLNRAS